MSPFGVLTTLLRGASRRALDSKHGPIGFYKVEAGRACAQARGRGREDAIRAKVARMSNRFPGGYIVDPDKTLELFVPDLTGFKLQPYVSHKTPKRVVGPLTASTFLKAADAPPKSGA